MKFAELLAAIGDEPFFETGLLLAGDVDPADVRRQLSRWTAAGRLHQLRRGLYVLAAPYAHGGIHPFVIANRIAPGSYVSLHSALAHHGAIPEHVPATTSVHGGRPGSFETPLGTYAYRHLSPRLIGGFTTVRFGDRQQARVATVEKALLDLVYLEPAADSPAFLEELRLQRLDEIDIEALRAEVARFGRPKLQRALRHLEEAARLSGEGWEPR